MNETNPQPIREIRAAQDIFEALTNSSATVYRCQDAVITGKLDLKHQVIKPAVEIINCEFQNEVDLRYVEFLHTVNLSKCIFKQVFNSGDEGESQTVYRKDLICNETTFEAGALFNGMRCEGSSFFHGARFLSLDHTADFSGTSIAKTIELNDAIFRGAATFNGMRCDVMGSFSRARFENEGKEVNFVGASAVKTFEFTGAVFKGGAIFNGCRFELGALFNKVLFENADATINFEGCSFGKVADFSDAVFKGGVSFGGSICELTGVFLKTRFEHPEKDVDFYSVSFGSILNCAEAVFEGAARFASAKCDTVFLNAAEFRNESQVIDFSCAAFATNLICSGARFRGGATFSNLKCENADFAEAEFANPKATVDFSHASFGWNLNCTGATFAGEAVFNGIRCKGGAFFNEAKFTNTFKGENRKRIDFRYSSYGLNLQCGDAEFHGEVTFESAEIGRALILAGTKFHDTAGLSNVTMRRLILGEVLPFLKPKIDLRQCGFEVYEGSKQQWRQVAERQSPELFSRDPYLQFEKYYRKIGDDTEANDIHYLGRCAVREFAKKARSNGDDRGPMADAIRWSRWRLFKDWLLKSLTGYGVKTWRLSLPILFFIAAGVGIFWPDDALRVKSPTPRTLQAAVTADASAPAAAPQASQPSPSDPTQKLFTRLGYSIDLFLPVVDLQQSDKWRPHQVWREAYSVVHILAGWLLIPLLLASLSGIVRRQ